MPNSMHRHRPSSIQPPLPVQRQPVAHGFNVLVCHFFPESNVGQVDGLIEEIGKGVLGQRHELRGYGFGLHVVPFRFGRAILACAWAFFYSHFPIPVSSVHGAIVSASEA